MTNEDLRGIFLWHELMMTDTEAAGAFYSRLTGWKPQPWEQNSSYTLFATDDGPMGGMMHMPDEVKAQGAPPHWLPFIGSPDTAATVEAARRLGAQVLKDTTEIPSVGRFAVLKDPQGAVFAAFTPSSPPPKPSGSVVPGDFSWHDLATTDPEAAFRFYSELFGWTRSTTHDMGGMTYQVFARAGRDIGGIYARTPDMPGPPHWTCYIKVRDINAAANTAKAAGGQIVHEPAEVPGGGWIAHILDPQGAAFAIHQEKQTAATKSPARPPRKAKPAPAQPEPPSPEPTEATRPAASSQPSSAARQTKPSARKKPAAKKAAVKKTTAKKAAAKKTTTKRANARKAAASKAPMRKKAATKKSASRKTAARRAPPRKAASKKRARKTAASKATRRQASRKTAARRGRGSARKRASTRRGRR